MISFLRRHLLAASALLRYEGKRPLLRLKEAHCEAVPQGKLYTPRGEASGGLVLVHGLHPEGIEFKGVGALARAFAGLGLKVLTPDVSGLREFLIRGRGPAQVVEGFQRLREHAGPAAPIGILGVSVGGGIGLVAAARPEISGEVACVGCLGAHHDLKRVIRYLIGGRIARPDGTFHEEPADELAAVRVAGGFAEELFAPEDVKGAREALLQVILHEPARAREIASGLSAAAQAKLRGFIALERGTGQGELAAILTRHEPALAEESPRGNLAGLRAPVVLIHGAEDNVVPRTELDWLREELPPRLLLNVTLTPLIGHVNLKTRVSVRDRLAFVHAFAVFLAPLKLG